MLLLRFPLRYKAEATDLLCYTEIALHLEDPYLEAAYALKLVLSELGEN